MNESNGSKNFSHQFAFSLDLFLLAECRFFVALFLVEICGELRNDKLQLCNTIHWQFVSLLQATQMLNFRFHLRQMLVVFSQWDHFLVLSKQHNTNVNEPHCSHTHTALALAKLSAHCKYKLCWLVTEAHVCEQLPRVVTWQCTGWESNQQPHDH